MKINSVQIHNFRSIQDATISLRDYSIIVGENNVGKSNIIDAIRCFYGDIRYEEQDKPVFVRKAQPDAWIEIEYSLEDNEYQRLDKKYKINPNTLRVRKDLQTGTFHGYTTQGLSKQLFYNERSQKPKCLGSIIYVPAVLDVKESTKLTGASALNGLASVICQQPHFASQFEEHIGQFVKQMNTVFAPQFHKVNAIINGDIKSTGVHVNIGPRRKIAASDMLKLLISMSVMEHSECMDLSQIGTGVQRRIIASLIKTSVTHTYKISKRQNAREQQEQMTDVAQRTRKTFMPKMSMLLFEEPEVSLHPAAVTDLAYNLRQFAGMKNQQVLATTHSSQLISEDIRDINSLIRVEKPKNRTLVFQNTIPDADLLPINNTVYFDRPRSDMFFANKVILVEGPTEYKLYQYLRMRGDISESMARRATLIETVGKWSMPYFIRILNSLNVRYSVLYDADGDPNSLRNQDVKNQFTDLLDYSYAFPKDIEDFCGIRKQNNHVIGIIRSFEDGTVPADKQAAVVQIYKDLLTKHK